MSNGNWIVDGDRFVMQTAVLGKVFLQPSTKIAGAKVGPNFWSKEWTLDCPNFSHMRKVSLPYAMTFEEAKKEALIHIRMKLLQFVNDVETLLAETHSS